MRVLSKVVTELNLGQWQQLFRLQGMGPPAQLHAGMLFLVSDTPLPPIFFLTCQSGLASGGYRAGDWVGASLSGVGEWGGSDQPQQKQAPRTTAASSLLS